MALTLTVPSGAFHLSGNPIWVKITGASAPAGSTNYKVLCKVTSTDGVLIGGPFIDSKVPGTTETWFDVSGYVDQPIEKTFQWPLVGEMTGHADDTLNVTYTAGETYIDSNGDLQENWEATGVVDFVLKGGVGYRKLGQYNDDSSSFYADYVTGAKFLTNLPDNQKVNPYQPIKLWFVAAANYNANLVIKAYYEDGTTYTRTNQAGFYIDIIHEMDIMPYHNDNVNLAPVINGVKMTRFEFQISGKTAKQTYYIDHSYHEQCNYLFFLNSFGGVDCVWLSGEVQKGFKSDAVQALKPFAIEGSAKDRTMIVSSRTGQCTWKINSGWKSQLEIEALKDLLLSKQVWLLEDASGYNQGTLHPVTIENSSSDLYNSQEDLFSLDLEITEAHNNQYL